MVLVDTVIENNKGKGPLKWVETSRMAVCPGDALLGRGCALYDYRTGLKTDLHRLAEDPSSRASVFRTINIWVEDSDNRGKKAWGLVCHDHPGKGMDAVLDADVSEKEIIRWYDFEKRGLETSETLRTLSVKWWDNDFVKMAEDICMPVRTMNLIRNWGVIPGRDVTDVLRYALTESQKVDIPLYAKERFVEAWGEAEDRLLDFPPNKRRGLL